MFIVSLDGEKDGHFTTLDEAFDRALSIADALGKVGDQSTASVDVIAGGNLVISVFVTKGGLLPKAE